jgi:phage N-6-adenine-methyltransferase
VAANLHLVGGDVDVELEAISRSTDLHQLEQIVAKGKRTFLEVGTALWRIKSAQLYKLTHGSWESWCEDRWWGSKRSADRQIAAARMVHELGPGLGPLVPTEAHARELARVDPEERAEVLGDASAAAGGVPTTVHVREAVERRSDGKKKAPGLQTRRTPPWFFAELNERFGPFKLDAYADVGNALCDRYYTKADNGHESPWIDPTFANPQFRQMALTVEQALRQAERGVRSIIVSPVTGSQSWVHELAIRGTEYRPDRRICFDTPEGLPTGVRACHYGLEPDACREDCGCVNGSDRDTVVLAFGGEHTNKHWRKGIFRVQRLELRGPPA